MKRYESYKDSGMQWIGQVPSHWGVRKIKFLFKERSQKGFPNEPVLCATQKYGVIPQNMYENRVVVVNKGLDGLKLVKKGDFVISLRSFQGGIEYAHYQGIISAAYTVLVPNESLNHQYIKYLFKSVPFIDLLQTCVTGIREGQNINYEVLRKNQLILPSPAEQQAIVDYLKAKTSKIEQYVTERERERELLESLKQTEIANVATRGLNPNVPMKDSGIPWIGMIPQHWTLRRIKYIFSESKEKSTTGLELPLSLGKECGIIPSSDKKNKTMESASYIGCKIVRKGDVVFNRFKARLFAISYYDGVVSSDYAVYRCSNEANAKYIVYLLSTEMYREAFNRKASGIGDGFSRLYTDDLFAFYAIFPPLAEQQTIVDYIESRLSKIDSYIADLQAEIDYLKEFKQRLVCDVVTGQICVVEPQKGELR